MNQMNTLYSGYKNIIRYVLFIYIYIAIVLNRESHCIISNCIIVYYLILKTFVFKLYYIIFYYILFYSIILYYIVLYRIVFLLFYTVFAFHDIKL